MYINAINTTVTTTERKFGLYTEYNVSSGISVKTVWLERTVSVHRVNHC